MKRKRTNRTTKKKPAPESFELPADDTAIVREPGIFAYSKLSRTTRYRLSLEGKFPKLLTLAGGRAKGLTAGQLRQWARDLKRN